MSLNGKELPTSKQPSILSLPRELRDQVYRYALIEHEVLTIDMVRSANLKRRKRPRFRPSSAQPALAHVCVQLREEVLPIYYSGNVFRFDYEFGHPQMWAMMIRRHLKHVSHIGCSLKMPKGSSDPAHFRPTEQMWSSTMAIDVSISGKMTLSIKVDHAWNTGGVCARYIQKAFDEMVAEIREDDERGVAIFEILCALCRKHFREKEIRPLWRLPPHTR